MASTATDQSSLDQADESLEIHLHLTYECGICGNLFLLDEECVALKGNEDGAEFLEKTETSFRFPSTLFPLQVGRWMICRRGHLCPDIHTAPPAVTLHNSCFQLYLQEDSSDLALGYLWRFAFWRNPWKSASPLHLPEPLTASPIALRAASEIHNIAHLSRLPFEIIREIHQYCKFSSIWRTAAALDLANRTRMFRRGFARHDPATPQPPEMISADQEPVIFSPSPFDFHRLPVRQVSSWTRDGHFVLSPPNEHVQVRLTVDAQGIKEIERIEGKKYPHRWDRSEQCAFVEQPLEDFEGMFLQIKDGLVQLIAPIVDSSSEKGLQRLHLGDIPSPDWIFDTECPKSVCGETFQKELPSFRDGEVLTYGARLPWSRWETVKLDSITGITFLYHPDGRLRSIDAHTSNNPFAQLPPSFAAPRLEKGWDNDHLVWNYFPLAPRDKILSIMATEWMKWEGGAFTLKYTSFVICTRLAGQIGAGCAGRHQLRTQSPSGRLLGCLPKVLIYESLPVIGVVRLATAGNEEPMTDEEKKAVQRWRWQWSGIAGNQILFPSNASMDGVVRTTVYYRRGSRGCSGIVLEYENGGQRAVGECRVGHQDTNTQDAPWYFCARPIDEDDREEGCQMEFAAQESHSHTESGWKCHEMGHHKVLRLITSYGWTDYEVDERFVPGAGG